MTTTLISPTVVVEDRTPAAVSQLRSVAAGSSWGHVEWHRPVASAAFSRRDSHEPGFTAAVESMRERGFEPFIRPVGGRLAAYHDGSLVLDVLMKSTDPRSGTTERFRIISRAIADGLRRLGVDAHVGELAGEYCPGKWSVHAAHQHKLVGTGQRLVKDAALVTAVIVVGDRQPLADAMTVAYENLGLDLDVRTVGAVSQHVPGVSLEEVQDVIGQAIAGYLPLSAPDLAGGRILLDSWDPR